MGSTSPNDPVIMRPETERVLPQHSKGQTFLDYCLSVKPKGAMADRTAFDVFLLMPWLGNILIVEELEGGDDFKYRVYGSEISFQSGFDMTGRCVSDFNSPFNGFFSQSYRQCIKERALLYSRHRSIQSRFDCDWERVICPVVTKEGRRQAVACNYPLPL